MQVLGELADLGAEELDVELLGLFGRKNPSCRCVAHGWLSLILSWLTVGCVD